MKVVALVLAAGSSKRMGKPKQLLSYKSTTLLGSVIESALETSVEKVFCVLGANFEAIKKSIERYNIEVIYNPNFEKGLSSSIVSGIQQVKENDAVFIMLADQPKITSEYLNELLRISQENPTKIIASEYEKKVGVPAIFPKKYFLKLLLLKGDKGARELLNSSKEKVLTRRNVNLIDIDTLEDYQKLNN